MEAVAWLAGEGHSDYPVCACPILSEFIRSTNDAPWGSDKDRTSVMLPVIPWMIGTAKGFDQQLRHAKGLVSLAHVFTVRSAFLAVCSIEDAGQDATRVRAASLAFCESPNEVTALEMKEAFDAYVTYVDDIEDNGDDAKLCASMDSAAYAGDVGSYIGDLILMTSMPIDHRDSLIDIASKVSDIAISVATTEELRFVVGLAMGEVIDLIRSGTEPTA